MFGDFWVRTMPTLLNALRSPNGAWDTDYTIVVATGGQRLQVCMGFFYTNPSTLPA
jgi:hypothetical protein